jgi:hypothetical protein
MTALFVKARNLAVAIQWNVSAEIAAYAPKLHAAVDDAEHKLHVWQADVEQWVESHFTPAAEAVKDESRKAYDAALRFVHDLTCTPRRRPRPRTRPVSSKRGGHVAARGAEGPT